MFRFHILIIFVIVPLQAQSQAPSCADLFSKTSPQQPHAPHFTTRYRKMGDRHFLVTETHRFDELGLALEINFAQSSSSFENQHPQPGLGRVPTAALQASHIKGVDVMAKLDEILGFSLTEFNRQPNLAQMKAELRQVARNTLAFARYISVRDLRQSGHPVVGTIRLIATPYVYYFRHSDQKVWIRGLENNLRLNIHPLKGPVEGPQPDHLPIETILNYIADRPQQLSPFNIRTGGEQFTVGIGHIIEPGNFAIKHGHRHHDHIFDLLSLEIFRSFYAEYSTVAGTSSAAEGGRTPLITFGKALSRRLYRRLSFSQIDTTNNYYVLRSDYSTLLKRLSELREKSSFPDTIIEYYQTLIRDQLKKDFFVWTPETHLYEPLNSDALFDGTL